MAMTEGLYGHTGGCVTYDPATETWEGSAHYRGEVLTSESERPGNAHIALGEQMQQLDERAEDGDGS